MTMQLSQWKEFKFSQKPESLLVADIGESLKLLNIDEFSGKPRITALAIIPLPESGREKLIVDSLRSFIQKNNLQHKNAILSPSLKTAFFKRLALPAMPKRELPEAVKWQLKQEVSLDLSLAVLDFQVIRERNQEDGSRVVELACALADEQEVKGQVLLLKEAGLECLAVIPLAFGYNRLLARYCPGSKTEATAVLHAQEGSSFISIHKNDKLEFYRQLPGSINKLKESLKGVLASDKGTLALSDEEIEEVVFKIGVPQAEAGYKDKLNSAQVLSLFRPPLERLAQEVRRSLAYYASQFQGQAVKRIILGGLISAVPQIDKFLSRELSLEVQKISLSDKNILSPGVDPQEAAKAYADFALAFDYRQNLNLLPREFRSEKFEQLQKVSLRWIALAAFLALLFSYAFARIGVSAYHRRLANAELHLNVLSEIREIKQRRDDFTALLGEVKRSQVDVDLVLKVLSALVPKEIFTQKFSLDCDSRSVILSGFIKGNPQNQDAVLSKFVNDLGASEYFSNADISSMEKARSGETDILKFSLSFKLR